MDKDHNQALCLFKSIFILKFFIYFTLTIILILLSIKFLVWSIFKFIYIFLNLLQKSWRIIFKIQTNA